MSIAPTLLWFRQDLRLRDNPALQAALAAGGPVIPVFILDEAGEGDWPWGGAGRWWWHHSLAALRADLRARGAQLVLRRGEAARIVPELLRETGATRVYWNRRYEPAARGRDRVLKAAWREAGADARSFNATLLFEPPEINNKSGQPFKVFTPFWRHCLSRPVAAPAECAGPDAWPAPAAWPRGGALEDEGLRPTIPWDRGLGETWEPGEAGAARQLRRFIEEGMAAYAEQRNLPGVMGTSRLSPHLHYGEIGPRQIWAAVRAVGAERGVFPPGQGAQVFLSEVGWREFAYHLLYHFPATPTEPLRPEFAAFPWREDAGGRLLTAWQRGRTGYPIVDAGMRELWATGWMHNRVRMIVGSFLVKHLRLPWQEGARWFWHTLVDADLANNTLGWQWTAGCGADAAPYFRVFAPVLQGKKFDAAGDYVRRWVPELARVADEWIHCPWEAPVAELSQMGVRLGHDYPRPLVDHATARREALAAFQTLKQS